MGDAGPPTPPPLLSEETALVGNVEAQDAPPLREVKVLVTGFGPFKSFLINPSWLIASALPDELYPSYTPASDASSDTAPKSPSYKITLIVHPSAIRVSYTTVSTLVPSLIAQHAPDFILHIGMAGGRDCYSLETRAHRDGYRIKDVDDVDGFTWGEGRWKNEGVPDVLHVGWDEGDVLKRWENGVRRGLEERNGVRGTSIRTTARGGVDMQLMWGVGVGASATPSVSRMPMAPSRADENRRKGVVKLSYDAGRFLCEYALFESLSRRWLDAQDGSGSGSRPGHGTPRSTAPSLSPSSPSPLPRSPSDEDLARSRLGTVAFLHVPGWTGVEDINRGVTIAEEAIRALVGSWEDGFRRHGADTGAAPRAYTTQHSEEAGQGVGIPWTG